MGLVVVVRSVPVAETLSCRSDCCARVVGISESAAWTAELRHAAQNCAKKRASKKASVRERVSTAMLLCRSSLLRKCGILEGDLIAGFQTFGEKNFVTATAKNFDINFIKF